MEEQVFGTVELEPPHYRGKMSTVIPNDVYDEAVGIVLDSVRNSAYNNSTLVSNAQWLIERVADTTFAVQPWEPKWTTVEAAE